MLVFKQLIVNNQVSSSKIVFILSGDSDIDQSGLNISWMKVEGVLT